MRSVHHVCGAPNQWKGATLDVPDVTPDSARRCAWGKTLSLADTPHTWCAQRMQYLLLLEEEKLLEELVQVQT